MLRIARALHRNLRGCAFDLANIFASQLDVRRADILFQALQLRCARDRNDPRLLRQQPRERDLRWRRFFSRRDPREQIDQRLIRLPSLGREAGDSVADIVALAEAGVLVDLAGQESFPQRAVRNEADTELLERRQQVLFRAPEP
jgi:hypothetical protein